MQIAQRCTKYGGLSHLNMQRMANHIGFSEQCKAVNEPLVINRIGLGYLPKATSKKSQHLINRFLMLKNDFSQPLTGEELNTYANF